MKEQHLFVVVVVVVIVIGLALALALIAAILNRAKTPEHDLRRRALTIVAGFGGVPLVGAAVVGSSLVAVVMVVAWAVVVVAGLHLALRSPQ